MSVAERRRATRTPCTRSTDSGTATVASGEVLPIGTTVVTCSATDAAGNTGNTGNVAFQVLVRSPAQMTSLLQTMLTSYALPSGSTSAVSNKIDQLLAAMPSDGQQSTTSACTALTPLNNQIRAMTGSQPGKTLAAAQADQLLTITRDITGALVC